MARLDIDTTTLNVACRALELFKVQYPERITVWAETAEDQLDIKIGSIAKHKSEQSASMRHHVYFYKTHSLMEV
tara:strand:- start:1091 stop:1312 length:222 start_codon:yes stop_codon:yes gene_type:complete